MSSKPDTIENSMELPQGVQFTYVNGDASASGPKGKCQRHLSLPDFEVKIEGKKVTVSGSPKTSITAFAHIRNMIIGCSAGYSQKMKIIYAHFPMAVKLEGKIVTIKNFVGEKLPRKARVMGATKVEIKGSEIVLSGPDKDDVMQTVANLRIATKIVGLDSRVFQDGIYPVDE